MPVPMNLTKAMPVITLHQVNQAATRVVVMNQMEQAATRVMMRMRRRRKNRRTVDLGQ